MKLRKNKKGFTIIELVIVIAVVGILTAILIPVFINLTQKANEASDQSLVKNLNTAMAIQEVDGKKNQTYHDAIEYLDGYGFKLANLATKSEYDLLWNSKSNRFLLNEQSAFEKDKKETGATDIEYWTIKDSIPAGNKFSIYAGLNYSEENPVNVDGIGFDAGDHAFAKINYTNTSGSEKSVVIRTSSYDTALKIDALSDTVRHYDTLGSLNVVAVADASYHENGAVAFAEIATGRIVLEKDSEVSRIHLTATSNEFNNIIIAKEASVDMPEFSRDPVDNIGTGKLIVALQNGTQVKIGETVYNTLEAAVAAAQSGDTIKLFKNIGAPSMSISTGYLPGVTFGHELSYTTDSRETQLTGVKDLILDLNGYSINSGSLNIYNTNLEIIDSSSEKTGVINAPIFVHFEGNTASFIWNSNSGTYEETGITYDDPTVVTLIGGTIKQVNMYDYTKVVVDGSQIVNSEVYVGSYVGYGFGVGAFGSLNSAQIEIKSGILSGTMTDIKAIGPNNTVTITGGAFHFNPSEYVDTEHYNVAPNANGSLWTVYAK